MSPFYDRLMNRIGNLVVRAVVAADNDGPKMQLLKILGRWGEIKDDLEHFMPYGLSYRVKGPDADGRGAETIVLAVEPDLRVCLAAADRRYRLTGLASGEVALHDDQGQVVKMGRNGIEITTTQLNGVTITAPKVLVISADVSLGGAGGAAVARVGDMVQVSGGSSAGLHPIVQGSATVRSL